MFSVLRLIFCTRSPNVMAWSMSRSTLAICRQASPSTRVVGVRASAGIAGRFVFLAFDDRHHLAQRNRLRRLDELISARGSAGAGNESGPFELQQNLHQKTGRDAVLVGDRANPHRLARTVTGGQLKHCQTGVFGLGGNFHVSDSPERQSAVCKPHSVLA